ncbi:MAG: LuxR C-terminal-related transcriptional regulator [Dehalococcoidia bacterium]|nr:LuxR C-terminal-related transcriptional regulator [Dehalococcoidia bacterium]
MTTKTEIIPREVMVSRRERELILLAARGLGNKEIANMLHLSERTVKSTLHRAYVKLGTHSRYQAVIQAIKLRLISLEEILTEDEIVELLKSAKPETINRIAQKALSKALDFNYPG